MLKYTLKRLLQSIVTILLIVCAVFLLLRLMPTDYFFTEDELMKLTEEQKESKLRAAGYLDPVHVQLGNFFKDMFQFDVGNYYTDADLAKVEEYAAGLSEDNKTKGIFKTFYKKMVSDPKAYYGKLSDRNRVLVDAYVAEHPEDTLTQELLAAYDNQAMTEELMKAVADTLGLNIFHFTFTFNLGESRRIAQGQPVLDVIGSKFGVSMRLGLIAIAISLLLGVTIGVFQARYKDGLVDQVGTAYTVFVNAVPHLVSYSLILVFGSRVLGLPQRYQMDNVALSSILPVACLSIGSIASYMLWIRRYMVDELNKDYIRLARLKGLSTRQVMFKHVLKNAFVPMVQQLPVSILLTVGGSILVERFFAVPGMGPLLTDAIGRYDCNLVQGIVLLYASLGIIGLFIGDVLMTLIDPRIRLTTKGGSR